MKLRRAGVRALVILVLGLVVATDGVGSVAPTQVHAAGQVVCLSPGHGGSDPGAVYWELTEKDLNYDISLRLKDLLSATGYHVVVTNDSTQDLGSRERAQICNNAGATTVLWIHLNASPDPAVDYFQAFWGKKNKDLAFCQAMTDKYNLLKPYPSSTTDFLQKQRVGQFASGVLLWTNAPACLVENVFLSNRDEGRRFTSDDPQDYTAANRRQQIAQELFDGLVAWYSR